jgi:autotransporter-associated beta strand protein
MNRTTFSVLTALAVAFTATATSAITHTWDGGFGFSPDSMNVAGNWSGGVPVSSSSNLTLVFPASPDSLAPDQDIAPVLTLQSMQFTGAGYTLTGNDYRFDNLGAAPSLTHTGANVIGTNLQFAVPTTITGSSGGNLFMQNVMSGSTVTFSTSSGLSQVTLSAAAPPNSIAANVTTNTLVQLNKAGSVGSSLNITGGAVRVNAASAVNAGTNVTVNPGTMIATYSPLDWFANNSIGTLNLNSNSTMINSSTLTITSAINATGNSLMDSLSGALNLGGGARPITVTGPTDYLLIVPDMSNGTYSKLGAGTLEIGGDGTYTGQNVVSAGTLRGYATGIGNDVLNNSLVELLGGSYSGVISGTGAVSIDNFVQYLSLNSYSGGTTIAGTGTLDAEAQYLHGSIVGNLGATLQVNAPVNQVLNATLAGSLNYIQNGPGVVTLANSSAMTGNATVNDGGLRLLASNPLGTAPISLSQPFSSVTLESVGSNSMPNHINFGGDVTVLGGGNLSVTSTTTKNMNWELTHNSTGNTTIDGKFTLGLFGSITVNGGQLTLGDPAAVGGFQAAGTINVNSGGTATLRSLNFISLPDVVLAGGTLNTPNGYAIPLGAALQGNGGVTGRVASANGSSVIANGNLMLGDSAHAAGVNLDGELYTNQHTVTLLDSNQSVLGSLTDIGTASLNGTLASANGFVLNFGRNIAGRGQIQSNNSLADAAIINGDVNGDSLTNYLEFTGYVKGVGTFNNVAFSGTFSPGLSPTLMTIGNNILMPSGVLDLEIGGLSRGGQYDAFDITGLMQLDGTLQVTLINAYSPGLGDQFLLFQGISGGSFGGTFDNYLFPNLDEGLAWDISLLYSNGILQVVEAVPEPSSLLPLLMTAALFWRRCR